MKIIKSTDSNLLDEFIKTISKGGLIIFPTETAYGAGVDATNHGAVTKLLNYKKRPQGKAISAGVSSKKMAEEYVEINKTAENIYKEFLPGPVTVISKSRGKVDPRLESENGTLGIRIPDHKQILSLIEKYGKPMTTTSANSSGKKTPYSIQDVFDNLSNKQRELIDLVIDGGELPKNLTSTVIDTTTDGLKTHRQGAIKFENKDFKIFNSKSVEDTIEFSKNLTKDLIKDLSKPIIFLLSGELGAGKTHFTKGVGKALRIKSIIKSPTYSYVSEHEFQLSGKSHKFFHVDAWKIENKSDLDNLGFQGWIKPGNVLVLEWPEIVVNFLGEEIFQNSKVVEVELSGKEEERKVRYWVKI